jgi:hypothetical protein
MTSKVMTSAEEAGGPKKIILIFFELCHGKEQPYA